MRVLEREQPMAASLQKILYTAEAEVQGGRQGHGVTSDGRLEVDLSAPAEMAPRPHRPGPNPVSIAVSMRVSRGPTSTTACPRRGSLR